MTVTKFEGDQAFPIRELSARTQVNTITLRAWERRYGLLKPMRTAKGHRLYSQADVAVVEKILALVARGVPLGKVKPLLQDGAEPTSPQDDDADWQQNVAAMILAAQAFNSSKFESLLRDAFANYPVPICRARLIEPMFTELSHYDDSGAALVFAQSQLLGYTLVRLSSQVSAQKSGPNITLMAGNKAPLWRLALMALELSDNECRVNLLACPFSVAAGIELAAKLSDNFSVFYQDGVLKAKDQQQVSAALLANPQLFMFGTAAVLAPLAIDDRVYSDVTSCITALKHLSNGGTE